MANIIIFVLIMIFFYPFIIRLINEYGNRLRILFSKPKDTRIFYGEYIEVKAFYLREFKSPPCISFVRNVDPVKAFEFISEGKAGRVISVFQRNFFNWQRNLQEFEKTIFRIKGNIMIEVGDDYVEILFGGDKFDYANKLVEVFTSFKSPERQEDHEINIITLTSEGLDLKKLDIKPLALDLGLYYNGDFNAVDSVIRERLTRENDKGIVLLHGEPGTGKTTYLRYLVGSIKKKVLFVSPSVAGNLMNPEFIDLLIGNPNVVLVIEDAENIILDRKLNGNSSVSNLLNISDGLLSDCLNVQVICTFNSALSLVDSALMRKGRLIARYEFGKLNIDKAQKLSDHLGGNHRITKPMTLAEVTNLDDTDFKPIQTNVIGFRRVEELIDC